MRVSVTSALMALATVSGIVAETCDITTIANAVSPFYMAVSLCQATTGYILAPPDNLPTTAQLQSICNNCPGLITGIKGTTLPSCTLNIGIRLDTFFNNIVKQCEGGASSRTGSDTSITPTTKAPAIVSTMSPFAPTSPTEAPQATSFRTSAPTTPTPTTTTKGGGISTTTIAIIAGGVVVLVIIIAVLVVRCKRQQDKLNQSNVTDGTAYTTVSHTTRGHAPPTVSVPFPDAMVLVPYQIPYDRIQMEKVISQGGYGEVLRGTYDNQVVAIKRLLASRREDHPSIRGFIQEIQLTASLQHECIVRFLGAAWDKPTDLCMISEFMPGGDVRSLLARFANNGHANGHDDLKLRIAIQVAHAMTYLHAMHPPVVHRDLKSRNILLTGSLDAKIIDFGVSCERQDVTMTAGVGTSLWMAPEVMLGKRYDEKADVFSFGVLLSELDTHELPYDHARDATTNRKLTETVLLHMISHGKIQPRFTEMAHRLIVGLARDCLQLNPHHRPPASELLYRINECIKHDPTLTNQTRTAIDHGLRAAVWGTRTTTGAPNSLNASYLAFNTRATTANYQ